MTTDRPDLDTPKKVLEAALEAFTACRSNKRIDLYDALETIAARIPPEPAQALGEPDADCITRPDGECVAPACRLHDAPSPLVERIIRALSVNADAPTDHKLDAYTVKLLMDCRKALSAPPASEVEPCPLCKGSGKFERPAFGGEGKIIERSCSVCKGTGHLSVRLEGPADVSVMCGSPEMMSKHLLENVSSPASAVDVEALRPVVEELARHEERAAQLGDHYEDSVSRTVYLTMGEMRAIARLAASAGKEKP